MRLVGVPSLVEEPLLERSYLCVFRREFAQVPLPANNTRITHKNISGYTRVLYKQPIVRAFSTTHALSYSSATNAMYTHVQVHEYDITFICTSYSTYTCITLAYNSAQEESLLWWLVLPRMRDVHRTQHQHPLCTHYDVRHRDGT